MGQAELSVTGEGRPTVEEGHSVQRQRHASPKGASPEVASASQGDNTAVAAGAAPCESAAATSQGSDEKSTTPRSSAAVTFLIMRSTKPDSGPRELIAGPAPAGGAGPCVLVR